MARTHSVAARRGNPKRPDAVLTCQTCHQPIEIGQPYKWFKMKLARGGVKKSYHPGCSIPPSHRTTSRMGTIWDAQSDLNLDGCESLDDISTEMQSFAETVREVGAEYSESADNMESGFGHETEQSSELRDRGEQLDSWADDLESWEFSGEEPEQEDFTTTGSDFSQAVTDWEANEPKGEDFDQDSEEGDEQYAAAIKDWEGNEPDESDYEVEDTEAYEEAVEEMLNEARSEAQGEADNCPV